MSLGSLRRTRRRRGSLRTTSRHSSRRNSGLRSRWAKWAPFCASHFSLALRVSRLSRKELKDDESFQKERKAYRLAMRQQRKETEAKSGVMDPTTRLGRGKAPEEEL